ncbi:hypothetical protein CsSME_00030246 [Camellia sinensis var. sinensis]
MNGQVIINPLCLDDVPSNDEWITEREAPALPREGNWLSVLDRNIQHGCDSDEDEVGALARNLEQACRDHIGGEHDEVYDVIMMLWIKTWMLEGILIMTLKMLLLMKDIEDLDGTVGGDDDDDVAMINVDCGNNDDNFGDNNDLF